MSTQQGNLFGAPAIIPVCFYCHQPHSKVTADRAELARLYPHNHPEGPRQDCICCTPDMQYTCPRCNGEDIDFAMHYAGYGGDETAELAQCGGCGWVGEATEAAPPVQPWAELEAVAMALPRPMPATTEDHSEMARRRAMIYAEVA